MSKKKRPHRPKSEPLAQKKRRGDFKRSVYQTKVNMKWRPVPELILRPLDEWEDTDWPERRAQIIEAARSIVAIYEELDSILSVKTRKGDNRAAERLEVRNVLRTDAAEAKKGIETLNDELDETPKNAVKLAKLRALFSRLAERSRRLLTKVAESALDSIVKVGVEDKLPSLIGTLAHGLKILSEMIYRII